MRKFKSIKVKQDYVSVNDRLCTYKYSYIKEKIMHAFLFLSSFIFSFFLNLYIN